MSGIETNGSLRSPLRQISRPREPQRGFTPIPLERLQSAIKVAQTRGEESIESIMIAADDPSIRSFDVLEALCTLKTALLPKSFAAARASLETYKAYRKIARQIGGRKNKKVTRENFAKRAGVTAGAITRYFGYTYPGLASAFGITIEGVSEPGKRPEDAACILSGSHQEQGVQLAQHIESLLKKQSPVVSPLTAEDVAKGVYVFRDGGFSSVEPPYIQVLLEPMSRTKSAEYKALVSKIVGL